MAEGINDHGEIVETYIAAPACITAFTRLSRWTNRV